jgi:hypothetical protein
LGDLQFGMLGFRWLAVLAVAACSWSVWILSKRNLKLTALFCLNPLVLIEAVNNSHNDITMLAFLMMGLAIYELNKKKHELRGIIAVLILWLVSVFTKLITVITPVLYLGMLPIKRWLSRWRLEYFDLAALALVAVMVLDGSKRFFSWYLLWALPVAVLAKNKLIRIFVISLSLGGLISYLPYLYTGEYTQELGYLRHFLFFFPGFLFTGLIWAKQLLGRRPE